MNANFERSGIYPFSVAPSAGWGHDSLDGKHVISCVDQVGKAVKIEEAGYSIVGFEDATRFDTAADAAVAAGKLAAGK